MDLFFGVVGGVLLQRMYNTSYPQPQRGGTVEDELKKIQEDLREAMKKGDRETIVKLMETRSELCEQRSKDLRRAAAEATQAETKESGQCPKDLAVATQNSFCDGKTGVISQDKIPEDEGVCLFGECYKKNSILRHFLQNIQKSYDDNGYEAIDPVAKRPFTLSDEFRLGEIGDFIINEKKISQSDMDFAEKCDDCYDEEDCINEGCSWNAELEIGTVPSDHQYNYDTNVILKRGYCAENITIPTGVTKIDDNAFNRCNSLQTILIPNSVKTIGKGAFYNCNSLPTILIPNSVKTIGSSAFSWCTSLKTITLPDSLERIEDSVFHSCEALKTITLPDSLKTMRWYAFNQCISLQTINLPESLETIGWSAFSWCIKLKKIILPDSGLFHLVKIEKAAFNGCISLETILIPNSVNTIEMSAFKGCKALSDDSLLSIVANIKKNKPKLRFVRIKPILAQIGLSEEQIKKIEKIEQENKKRKDNSRDSQPSKKGKK